jgi:mannose/fructose-specific phosphotransferase system component IIA
MIGIVICHKSLAFELTTAAKTILGHHHDLFPFTNDKVTIEQLLKNLEKFLVSKGNPEQAVVMVDLRGGNCWTVARMLARAHPGFHVLSGVNLPMIFSFLTKKEQFSISDLLQMIESDARRGISIET